MDILAILNAMESETTFVVKLWMGWMAFIFLLSIVFIPRYKAARWALAAISATGIGILITWALTHSVHLFAIGHLIFWTPLAVYMWKTTLSPRARAASPEAAAPKAGGLYQKSFMLWATLLVLTIIISLVFDVRDIYLVATGVK